MIEPLPIYMQMRFLFLQNTKKTFLCISRNIFQFFPKVLPVFLLLQNELLPSRWFSYLELLNISRFHRQPVLQFACGIHTFLSLVKFEMNTPDLLITISCRCLVLCSIQFWFIRFILKMKKIGKFLSFSKVNMTITIKNFHIRFSW